MYRIITFCDVTFQILPLTISIQCRDPTTPATPCDATGLGCYPKAAEQLALRAQHYNEGIALAEQLAAEGKVLIIAPDDTCGVKTLTRDQEALKKLYTKGIRDAQAIEAFIK